MAKTYTFTLEGDVELQAVLRAAQQNAPKAVAQAIYEEAWVIFGKSQILVPVDTSALRGSGDVSAIQGSGRNVYVDIYYGGPAAPYALYVHEIIGNYHKAPTQAKYLEQPFMESLAKIQNNISRRIIDILKTRSI